MKPRSKASIVASSAFWLTFVLASGGLLLVNLHAFQRFDSRHASLEHFQRSLRSSIERETKWLSSFVSGCSDLSSYFDMNELHVKIQENIEFHQLGGNLKAVQSFLDQAVDPTLDKLGLRFIPQGQQKGIRGATKHLRQHYDEHPSERQGYGEALPGKWNNEHSKVLHEKRWIDVIEPRKHHDKWDSSLGPMGPACKNLVQLGNKDRDGYKFICMPETEQKEECHVISVGGNDNWKFESAIHKTLGCTTYTFDCTLPGGQPKNKPDNDQIKFFNYCIDGHTHEDKFGRQFLTYEDMLQTAGIQTAPTYFKIDVEGFEYDIFTQMMHTPHLLPQQIQVELHWASRMTGLSWMPRTRSAGEIALLTSMMFNAGDYMPLKLDFNPHCTSCMEVLYFRTPCAKQPTLDPVNLFTSHLG